MISRPLLRIFFSCPSFLLFYSVSVSLLSYRISRTESSVVFLTNRFFPLLLSLVHPVHSVLSQFAFISTLAIFPQFLLSPFVLARVHDGLFSFDLFRIFSPYYFTPCFYFRFYPTFYFRVLFLLFPSPAFLAYRNEIPIQSESGGNTSASSISSRLCHVYVHSNRDSANKIQRQREKT